MSESHDQQFDDELKTLVEKQRARDKSFDLTASINTGSYLVLPDASYDVKLRQQQDTPVGPSAEELAEIRQREIWQRYKDAVAFGIYSEWLNCKQADGVRLRYQSQARQFQAAHPESRIILGDLNTDGPSQPE